MMRVCYILVLLCLFCGGVSGQHEAALKQLLETPGLKSAAIGIAVKRIADGKMVVAHQAGMALTPASVTKLIPTFFALQEKGKNFRFVTTIVYTGEVREGILYGDLIVLAGGDPTLESRYFPNHTLVDPIIIALEKAGIHQINGQIKVEGAQQGTDIPGSWPWEDVSNYYAALYLPFNYRDNTCMYDFQTEGAGTPAKLKSVTPALPGVKIINQVIASVEKQDKAWIYGGPYSEELYIRGTLPQNRTSYKVKGAMHRPAETFVAELTEKLKVKGISIENKVFSESQRKDLLTLSSPELGEIVFHTNKASVNLFAEALGQLAVGDQGTDKMIELLKKANIPTEGIILKDACGLSPMNALPALVFTDLLIYAAKSGEEAFMRSLPVAGKDGGLSGYCVNQVDLKDQMKAKTGSMTGVRCLSGYLTTTPGEQFAFTVLINHYTCTTSQLQRAVGKFLQSLLG